MTALSTVPYRPAARLARTRGVPWRPRRLRLLLALVLLLCGVSPVLAQSAPASAQLSSVRFGEQGRFTRVVLELDRRVPFEARLERAPARLVIDFPALAVRLRPDPLGRPRGLATALHGPSPAPNGTRITVDLARPAEFVARFWIPPGEHSPAWRLVVDLEPEGASRAAPATARAEPVPPLPRPRPSGPGEPGRSAPPAGPSAASAAGAARPTDGSTAAASVAAAATPVAVAPAAPVPANGVAPGARPRFVVAIDPGHGGSDPGTIGVDGVKEKDLVLAMGLELARALEATGRYGVVLTRREDVGLGLRERIGIARDGGAQLLISLHADSIADPQVAGASVYTLSETASDEEAAALAAKENKADILSTTDLSVHDPIVASILIDLAQRDTLNKSVAFSQLLAEELAKVTSLLRYHRRFAGFAVLKSPEIPSVLVELGYLSNPEEARRLGDPHHRRKLAAAIVAAVDRYTGAVD